MALIRYIAALPPSWLLGVVAIIAAGTLVSMLFEYVDEDARPVHAAVMLLTAVVTVLTILEGVRSARSQHTAGSYAGALGVCYLLLAFCASQALRWTRTLLVLLAFLTCLIAFLHAPLDDVKHLEGVRQTVAVLSLAMAAFIIVRLTYLSGYWLLCKQSHLPATTKPSDCDSSSE